MTSARVSVTINDCRSSDKSFVQEWYLRPDTAGRRLQR